ncbi:unnamed protein product [Lactuca virosa]|uniref:Transposase InsH N-terminal domain-containing protein n=1 Tax=Lactuca virosa TaxID=75947 RepID=A0AAU9M442_9ASTR|nr:unnamed protein product [Lactuca virosa]
MCHIHDYEVDRGNQHPLGLLQVMMALTRDGQLYPNLAKERDNRVCRFALLGDLATVCPTHLRPRLAESLEVAPKQLGLISH